MQKTVESIQTDLDNELTLRQQAVRAKSKLEADLADIEVQLGHANHQAEQAIRKCSKFEFLMLIGLRKLWNSSFFPIAVRYLNIFKTSAWVEGTEYSIPGEAFRGNRDWKANAQG